MKKIFATIALSSFCLTPAVKAAPILPTGNHEFSLPFQSNTSKPPNLTQNLLSGSSSPQKLANTPKKIPQISHSIWLPRHPSSSIPPKFIEILKEKLSILSEDALPWTHLFWTTRSFEKIKDLTNFPLEVKFIEDHAFMSLPTVTRLMGQGYVGAAVDLMRYDIMERFGGFYSDLNYRIWKSPSFLFQAEFISPGENYMMAATPNHKVFKSLVPTLITLLREESINAYKIKETGDCQTIEESQSCIQTSMSSFLADTITTGGLLDATKNLLSETDSYYFIINDEKDLEDDEAHYPSDSRPICIPMDHKDEDKFIKDITTLASVCSALSFGRDTIEEEKSWLNQPKSLDSKSSDKKSSSQSFTGQHFTNESFYNLVSPYHVLMPHIKKNPLKNTSSLKEHIPFLSHHIWLTDPLHPQSLRPQDLQTLTQMIQKMDEGNQDSSTSWEHILWTNTPQHLNHAEVGGLNIKIRDIPLEFESRNTVLSLAQKRHFGMASDLLRFEILSKKGGFYADLNYLLSESPTPYMLNYDFLVHEDRGGLLTDVYMIAAKPNHPILEKAFFLTMQNFMSPDPFVKEFQSKLSPQEKTGLMTYIPFNTAVFAHANMRTRDLIFPLETKYPHPQAAKSDVVTWDMLNQAPCSIEGKKYMEFFSNFGQCMTSILGYDSADGDSWVHPTPASLL